MNNLLELHNYGTSNADTPLAAMQIERHPVGPHDVLIDVLHCGICHPSCLAVAMHYLIPVADYDEAGLACASSRSPHEWCPRAR